MKLSELNQDERLALMGLLKAVIRADKDFSAEEAEEVKNVKAALGADVWRYTLDLARQHIHSLEDVKRAADQVLRQPARELIFGTLHAVAVPGDIVPAEEKILTWLALSWKIDHPLARKARERAGQ
jgi:hypothetical protein